MIDWRTDSEDMISDPSNRFEIGELPLHQSKTTVAYLHDKTKCGGLTEDYSLPCMSFFSEIDEAKAEAEGRLA